MLCEWMVHGTQMCCLGLDHFKELVASVVKNGTFCEKLGFQAFLEKFKVLARLNPTRHMEILG